MLKIHFKKYIITYTIMTLKSMPLCQSDVMTLKRIKLNKICYFKYTWSFLASLNMYMIKIVQKLSRASFHQRCFSILKSNIWLHTFWHFALLFHISLCYMLSLCEGWDQTMLWCTFWCHGLRFNGIMYILMSWHFNVMIILWRRDICSKFFYVLICFLT